MEKAQIDIRCMTNEGNWEYYEIKTDRPKYCIRKAIGQLLEYSYYPGRSTANKFIIIGEYYPSKETQEYLIRLRKQLNLPIYYQSFIIGTNELSREY